MIALRAFATTLIAGLLWMGAGGALAQPKFPALSGRVVDEAQMLSAQTEQQLDGELAQLEARTGRQLVVATVVSLQGYEIEEYGYQLGRAWGVGREKEDDGAILLVAPNEKRVRIEVGYGLEPVLTDALSSVILQQKVLPQFREGRMEQGVVNGAQAVIQQLALPEEQARAQVARAAEQPRSNAALGGGISLGTIVTLLILFWVLSGVLRGFGRRRRRGGSSLWWLLPMVMNSGGHRGGGWSGGGFGGGGFSGGGGSFGGGGASGRW